MANPSGTHHEPSQPSRGSSSFNGPINVSSDPAPENSAAAAPLLQHNPGCSTDWTAEEQLILEEGLVKYASEMNIIRYAKISIRLQNKTVRDVALRCRWITKKEYSRRKKEDQNLTRKSKDKKDKVIDPPAKSCHLVGPLGFPLYDQGLVTNDNDDGNSYSAIGGAIGQLLEQNVKAFERISANFAAHRVKYSCHIHENINLFCHARNNILKVLKNLNDTPDIMRQMPPLPVKVNEELANSILPCTPLPMQS